MTERRGLFRFLSLIPVGIFSAAAAPVERDFQTAAVAKGKPLPKPSEPEPVPSPPPLQDHVYDSYQLLGAADDDSNVFGSTRPRDWHGTKAQVQSALGKATKPADPIHTWLKTFDVTFDERAANIILDATSQVYRQGSTSLLRYESQLYEGLLRSAAVLLDRCLRYRLEMGQFETAGVGAGLAYLGFTRLRPLHKNLISHSNAADLVKIEKGKNQRARDKYAEAGSLSETFQYYEFEAKKILLTGDIQESGSLEVKGNYLIKNLTQQLDISSDLQLAQFTRFFAAGSSSNWAERYLRLASMLTEDLGDAFCRLYSASKGVQQVLGLAQVSVAMSLPVNVDIPAFAEIAAIQAWVDQIVPLDPTKQRQPDIVDALVLWCRAVTRTIDAMSQFEAEFNVSIPLNQPWGTSSAQIVSATATAAAFSGTAPTGKLTFNLTAAALPMSATADNIRVVGVGLLVERSEDDASPVQFQTSFPHTPSNPVVTVGTTPAASQEPTSAQIAFIQQFERARVARLNAIVVTPQQKLPSGLTYSRPSLFLPNIRLQGGSSGDLEPMLNYDATCRGLYPFGSWTISFDSNALAFFQSNARITPNWVTGVILHLRLRAAIT